MNFRYFPAVDRLKEGQIFDFGWSPMAISIVFAYRLGVKDPFKWSFLSVLVNPSVPVRLDPRGSFDVW